MPKLTTTLALHAQEKFDEAIAEYREVCRINPDFADARANLGLALRMQGRFPEARRLQKGCANMVKANPAMVQSIDRDIAVTERMASLFAAIARGDPRKDQPKDANEGIAFAKMCYERSITSALGETFRAGVSRRSQARGEHAGRSSLQRGLRGGARGRRVKEKTIRSQATKRKHTCANRHWNRLKADLAVWSKQILTPAQKRLVDQKLQHWKVDADLDGRAR